VIPHSRPTLDSIDLAEIQRVLESGHLARGTVCEQLETSFCAQLLGPAFSGHSVQSGTLALELGLRALKPRNEFEVITSTLACASLVHAIRAAGGRPVLCDTLPDGNLDCEKACQLVTKKTLAFIAVHLYGKPADLNPLLETGVPVFEDCAQALGVEGPAGRVGTAGAVMMTSFYATKLICAGQGGMVASSNSDLIEEVRDLCCYDEREDERARLNGNLSDWAALPALPQVEKFQDFLVKREAIAKRYSEAFEEYSDQVVLPSADAPSSHAWYRYVVLVPGDSDTWIEELNSLGVEAKRPVFRPLHGIFVLGEAFPVAEEHWRRSLSLPIYPSLSEEEQDQVMAAFRKVAGH